MEKINIDSRIVAFNVGMFKLNDKICFNNNIYQIGVTSATGYMSDFNTIYNIWQVIDIETNTSVLIFSGTCDELEIQIIEGLKIPKYINDKIHKIDKYMILNAC